MFRPVRFKQFEDGHIGYNYCRGCLKKKTRRKWSWCFCSEPCMNDWIEKNRLVFLMFSDYKNIIFGKEFNVKRIMDLKEATKILTPIIINKVTRNIKEQINDVILDYGNSDSIETMLKVEQNKDLFLEIKDRA